MEIVGIDQEKIKAISKKKKEEEWILKYRLDSYQKFMKLEMPSFGPDANIDFSKVIYYKANEEDEKIESDWNSVLKPVVNELDSLGVLESEQHMGGMGVQYESEVIYHSMLKELEEKKVVFTSIEVAMKEYPELVKKYFGKIVNKKFFASKRLSGESNG